MTHREQQAGATWVHLALAVAASLLVAVLALTLAPRSGETFHREVDVAGVAEGNQGAADFTLAVPELKGWSANEASLEPVDAVQTWYASFLGPDDSWLTITQAKGAGRKWLGQQTGEAVDTGTRQAAGHEWRLMSTGGTTGNQYMVATIDGVTYVVMGQADLAAFDAFAKASLDSVAAGPRRGSGEQTG
jgi:hypothetical protein